LPDGRAREGKGFGGADDPTDKKGRQVESWKNLEPSVADRRDELLRESAALRWPRCAQPPKPRRRTAGPWPLIRLMLSPGRAGLWAAATRVGQPSAPAAVGQPCGRR